MAREGLFGIYSLKETKHFVVGKVGKMPECLRLSGYGFLFLHFDVISQKTTNKKSPLKTHNKTQQQFKKNVLFFIYLLLLRNRFSCTSFFGFF